MKNTIWKLFTLLLLFSFIAAPVVVQLVSAEADPPPGGTIVDIAVADGRFETLVAALTAADLVDTLSGEGPFTVFAPTDDAFDALPEGTLEALLDDIPALTDILLYHVVDGLYLAEDVVGLQFVETLQGQDIDIRVVGGRVFLNDEVEVIITDIIADNGVIHVIDTVLLPPDPLGTIVDIAVADGRFDTLVTALTAADLVETLSGKGRFTVFAPTDDAFDELPEGTLAALLDDIPALTDILLYHVVDGRLLAEDVVGLQFVETLQGQDIDIRVVGGRVFLNDEVEVIITDILADNGVIHVIDTVLLPPDPLGTIVDIAVADGRFDTLVTALTAADLVETLSGKGRFTVFAPTDEAFDALPEGTLEALLDDIPLLTQILLYHVVDGRLLAEDVVLLDEVETLQGEVITISVDEDGRVLLNGVAEVIITDILADNGVIHVIDTVLLPPEPVFTYYFPLFFGGSVGTIVDIAVASDDFTTLVAALTAADLVDTLSGEGPFTVFAPTDEAFDALPEGTLEALLGNIPALTDILLYHVVDGRLLAEDVVGLQFVETLQGQDIDIRVVGGRVFLNDDVEVIITDIIADNGVIHVIDTVLLPPVSVGTIVDIAVEDGRFTTLVAALEAADLVDALSGKGRFTVFAPTDDAFDELPEGLLDDLLDDIDALTEILLYHVVDGLYLAADVVLLDEIETLQGEKISILIDNGSVFLNGVAEVIIADIIADNGVIHVIDAVLVPPGD